LIEIIIGIINFFFIKLILLLFFFVSARQILLGLERQTQTEEKK